MKIKMGNYIKRKLLYLFQSVQKLERKKQLLIASENDVIDFNLKIIRIGDELKYFRTLKK